MKIINFIICDDIRHEEGNKVSLMGVYDEKIIFSVTPDQVDVWPKAFSFAVFVQAALEPDEPSKGVKKIVFSVGQEGNKHSFPLPELPAETVSDEKKLKCVAKVNNFQLLKAPLTFDITFYNSNEEEVFRIAPDFPIRIDEAVITNQNL